MVKGIVRQKAAKDLRSMLVQELPSVALGPKEIKVAMRASRINPVDMDLMKGFPGLKYKAVQPGGIDGAGEVLEADAQKSGFAVGDQIFFYRPFSDIGSWVQEVSLRPSYAAKIPAGLSLEEAGSIALPLLTAYEGLLSLQPQAGQRILIHGAGGGVGFQAVQLAKRMGLEVIANAGPKDEEDLKRAGVAQFINYRSEDYRTLLGSNPPDFVFDVLGKNTLLDSIKLKPKRVVSVAHIDVDKMAKTGVKLPSLLRPIMQLMGLKARRTAKKYGVSLIGQVTGPNGKLLAEAAALISDKAYFTRSPRTLSLETIAQQGLSPKDLGKTILF